MAKQTVWSCLIRRQCHLITRFTTRTFQLYARQFPGRLAPYRFLQQCRRNDIEWHWAYWQRYPCLLCTWGKLEFPLSQNCAVMLLLIALLPLRLPVRLVRPCDFGLFWLIHGYVWDTHSLTHSTLRTTQAVLHAFFSAEPDSVISAASTEHTQTISVRQNSPVVRMFRNNIALDQLQSDLEPNTTV